MINPVIITVGATVNGVEKVIVILLVTIAVVPYSIRKGSWLLNVDILPHFTLPVVTILPVLRLPLPLLLRIVLEIFAYWVRAKFVWL